MWLDLKVYFHTYDPVLRDITLFVRNAGQIIVCYFIEKSGQAESDIWTQNLE